MPGAYLTRAPGALPQVQPMSDTSPVVTGFDTRSRPPQFSEVQESIILRGIRALWEYESWVRQPPSTRLPPTEKLRARLRYEILQAWGSLLASVLPKVEEVCGPGDLRTRAAKFFDLYARRMPAEPDDDLIRKYGWTPVARFDPMAPPPPPPIPPSSGPDYDEKTGKITVPGGHFFIPARVVPQLGCEPGESPRWETDVWALGGDPDRLHRPALPTLTAEKEERDAQKLPSNRPSHYPMSGYAPGLRLDRYAEELERLWRQAAYPLHPNEVRDTRLGASWYTSMLKWFENTHSAVTCDDPDFYASVQHAGHEPRKVRGLLAESKETARQVITLLYRHPDLAAVPYHRWTTRAHREQVDYLEVAARELRSIGRDLLANPLPGEKAKGYCYVQGRVTIGRVYKEGEGPPVYGPAPGADAAPLVEKTDVEVVTPAPLLKPVAEPETQRDEDVAHKAWVTHCGGQLKCSPDFGFIRRGTDEFTLNPGQRAVIRHMVEHWSAGRHAFTNRELLDAADSTADYVRDIFRSNGKAVPAWNNLIVAVQGSKGMYTLGLTTSER